MSLLIKGIKMPESCIQCFAQMGGWCYVAPPEIDEKVAPTVEKAAEQGRPEWCPLIELPDHGDLIDRDAVVMRLAEWSKRLIETYGENDEYVKCLSEVLEGLGCDDVIIPAERDEDPSHPFADSVMMGGR